MRVVVTETHPRDVKADAVVQVFLSPVRDRWPVASHLSTCAERLIIPGVSFLRHFTGLPRAHVDMAGKAHLPEGGAVFGRGATGLGGRLLVAAARGFAAQYGRGPN